MKISLKLSQDVRHNSAITRWSFFPFCTTLIFIPRTFPLILVEMCLISQFTNQKRVVLDFLIMTQVSQKAKMTRSLMGSLGIALN